MGLSMTNHPPEQRFGRVVIVEDTGTMVAMKLFPLFAGASGIFAQALQCPQNIHGQASAMIASNIARDQGAAASSSGTGLIELGIFYQALRESIAATNNTGSSVQDEQEQRFELTKDLL
jgi:hypothetical protein